MLLDLFCQNVQAQCIASIFSCLTLTCKEHRDNNTTVVP